MKILFVHLHFHHLLIHLHHLLLLLIPFFISTRSYYLNSNILEIKFFILRDIDGEEGKITGCFRDSWKDFMFWLVFHGTHPNKTLIMFFLRSTSPLLSTTHHILCCRLASPRILAEEPCTEWYPHLFHFPGCPSLAVIWQIQSQPIWPHSLAEGCSGP